jgi:selenocysteine-specific elongation factor
VGDELELAGRRARVRSLHAQNRAVDAGVAGQRCAVALAGLEREAVSRGDWLTHPAVALQTQRFDARLRLWPGEAKPLRSGARVHLHLGAQGVTASVAVLNAADALAPGESAWVQLISQHPVGAWRGDRVVLRDAGASRTLAGGIVLDPFAPTRYRRAPERLAELAAMEAPEREARLAGLLAQAPLGLDLAQWARAEGVVELPAPVAALSEGGWALGDAAAARLADRLVQVLAEFHAKAPDELGPDAARLRRLVAPRLAEPLWRALLNRERAAGRVAQRGAFAHLPAHGVQLSAVEQRIAQKVAPRLIEAGFEGAWARDLARDAGETEPLMRATLARLAQQGELHQVVKDLFYATSTLAALAGIARRVGDGAQGTVLAAGFRDATGLGRKRAIQVLEYFDRIGLLRRIGDEHRLRADSTLFAEGTVT